MYPLAALYRIGYIVHHKLCLAPGKPTSHAQVVIVGSYRIGGAGKTPFCAWLASELCGMGKKVAVLCHAAARDEAALLKNKLPRCTVIATRNRYKTAREIDAQYDIILCDDGFEDSRLQFAKAICLEWGDEPQGIADLFPAGRARSLPSDHRNVALRLKCAGDTPDIRFCFQQIRNAQGDAPEAPATLLAGIGDPERFFRDAERAGLHASKTIALRDHGTGIRDKAARLIAKGVPVVTTEKDACRLDAETVQSENLFVAVQSVDVVPDARQKIMALLR
ncbi:MAG: tetraacyldisaccharide 4'-kinase [Fibrobacter sp.]|nr:tetraacyldisaccharide 4'-kinase [Fibrobacter sp.]